VVEGLELSGGLFPLDRSLSNSAVRPRVFASLRIVLRPFESVACLKRRTRKRTVSGGELASETLVVRGSKGVRVVGGVGRRMTSSRSDSSTKMVSKEEATGDLGKEDMTVDEDVVSIKAAIQRSIAVRAA
jgi:hypothetical protein